MKSGFIRKHKISIIGIVVGAVAGWAYYFFVGCKSGTCMIASKPQISIPYGAVMGYLFAGIIKK